MSSYGNVNMADVAKVAGVSLSTVSRAIHKKGDISKESQIRINTVMKQMGYRPNLIVKALRTGRTQTIGVITSCDLTFDGEIVRGIHDYLQEVDYVPVLQLIEPGGPPEVELLNRLLDRRVDGVIMKIFSNMGLERYVDELKRRKIPIVACDVTVDNMEIDFVGNNDELGGRLAAEYLLKLGHRRLGSLVFQRTFLPSSLRIKAFESVVRQYADATVCLFEDPTFGSDDLMATKLLNLHPRPTAVFVNNDKLALGVYSAAEKLGLKIPDDLSVIGFGDFSLCDLVKPGLTTIHQNPYEIGLKSAEMIMERLENNDLSNPKRVIIDVQLVDRGSVAKPRSCE
jgi:LacI family transcriptional regulator, galactose operon repressor